MLRYLASSSMRASVLAVVFLTGCAQSPMYSEAECGPFPANYKDIVWSWYDSTGGRLRIVSIDEPVRCRHDDKIPGWKTVVVAQLGKETEFRRNPDSFMRTSWHVTIQNDKVVDAVEQ